MVFSSIKANYKKKDTNYYILDTDAWFFCTTFGSKYESL